jgi:predicted RNA binding protein YcfA (HicA-like mRNA interferase family)
VYLKPGALRRPDVVKGFYDEVVRLLREAGYYHDGGSKHQKWCHDDGKPTVTVPHNILSRHTANGILKDAGISKKL